MKDMTPERTERFVKWATGEFEVALRQMLRENSRVHLFDFDGTTAGVKEPWSFLIMAAPKKELEPLEKMFGVVAR